MKLTKDEFNLALGKYLIAFMLLPRAFQLKVIESIMFEKKQKKTRKGGKYV